jgi:hypothetical protein
VSTRDRNGVASFDDLRDLGALIGDRRPLERTPSLIELRPIARAAIEMHAIDVANGLDRRACLILEDVVGRLAVVDDVLRVERVLETDPIEILTMTKDRLPIAMRRVELWILAEDLFGARVKSEIDRAAAEMLLEIVVLFLALLPASRDRSNAALDVELRDGFTQRWIEALRAKEHDSARIA